MGEYRQAFANSNLILDMGYTEGYKNTTSKKISGDKSHFFTKFTKNFVNNENSETNLSIQTQSVSNDKYLELYKIESNLVDYNQNYFENSFNYSHSSNDYFLVLMHQFENLKETYNVNMSIFFPDILFDKNL